MSDSQALAMWGISKAFPGVQALDGVDFALNAGEVMGLVGENGAGKSTLIKILAGAHLADAGEIVIKGQPVKITSPRHAQALGVAVIYQELNLAEQVSVAENIFVGREFRTRLGLVDFTTMYRQTRVLLDTLHIDIDPRTEVRRLSVARKQMVEIAKALALDASIVVMDEPTSALTENEVEVLLSLIHKLRDRGVAVVYISHRLDEIFRVSDRITVLRDGRLVGVRLTAESNADELVSMMVGRKLEDLYGRVETPRFGDSVFQVHNLYQRGRLHNISFNVRAGEILGLAGLIGAGRTEVARALFGVDRKDSGTVLIENQPVHITSPRQAIDAGLGYLPEDRKLQALFLNLAVRPNIAAASMDRLSRAGFIQFGQERTITQQLVQQLSIRTPTMEQPVRNLSGGNQQKVVIAKWLAVQPKVLILDEPTRGVDVGAKSEIYTLMRQMARRGMAIIMISSELSEILGMSDRIIVLRLGRVAGEINRVEANEEKVMSLATGTTGGV
jgi:ribose transport system ATP-binding protein